MAEQLLERFLAFLPDHVPAIQGLVETYREWAKATPVDEWEKITAIDSVARPMVLRLAESEGLLSHPLAKVALRDAADTFAEKYGSRLMRLVSGSGQGPRSPDEVTEIEYGIIDSTAWWLSHGLLYDTPSDVSTSNLAAVLHMRAELRIAGAFGDGPCANKGSSFASLLARATEDLLAAAELDPDNSVIRETLDRVQSYADIGTVLGE